MKVHPHCLTGAKGIETDFKLQGSLVFKEDEDEFENLLDLNEPHLNQYRDSDMLEQLNEDDDQVCKLALDTEEDDTHAKYQLYDENCKNAPNGAVSTRVSVITSGFHSPQLKSYNDILRIIPIFEDYQRT